MNTTLAKGSCEAPCGSSTGVRKIVWSQMIVSLARHGGNPCDIQEKRIISQPCKSDKIVPCPGGTISEDSSSEGGATGFLFALALFLGLLLAAWIHTHHKEKFSKLSSGSNVVGRDQQSLLGNHIVLEKDEELKRNADNLIRKERQLEEEFLWLEAFDKEKIEQTKMKTVSAREENRLHNRYIDIGNLSDQIRSVNFIPFFTQLLMTTTMSP